MITPNILEIVSQGKFYFYIEKDARQRKAIITDLSNHFQRQPCLMIDQQGQTAQSLVANILRATNELAKAHQLTLLAPSWIDTLVHLIRQLAQQQQPLVVLFNNYEGRLEKELAENKAVNEVLNSLFDVLYACDEYLKFVWVGGVRSGGNVGVLADWQVIDNEEPFLSDSYFLPTDE